ncbi:unnamed protein product [Protopolystoma xenopodis]|uniref:Uncharacterized protein n=1 Tax=Protopolystoma xenopodis TaxID=117903 RepID=A0A3S5A8S0_9PLAT|nr:unnamed protein product [Protopolystoma xenopodis]
MVVVLVDADISTTAVSLASASGTDSLLRSGQFLLLLLVSPVHTILSSLAKFYDDCEIDDDKGNLHLTRFQASNQSESLRRHLMLSSAPGTSLPVLTVQAIVFYLHQSSTDCQLGFQPLVWVILASGVMLA